MSEQEVKKETIDFAKYIEHLSMLVQQDFRTITVEIKGERNDTRQVELESRIKELEEENKRFRIYLRRLSKVGPPSTSTSGDDWAMQCLKDNCELAKQALKEFKGERNDTRQVELESRIKELEDYIKSNEKDRIGYDNLIGSYKIKIDALEEENKNLKKIIAKELCENDELGCEFVYVNVLRKENKRFREVLIEITKCNDCDYILDLAEEALKPVSNDINKLENLSNKK